jgi:DNA polymerase III epsilon subunit-like protein
MYLILDTETTGFPRRNAPLAQQPHMVQIGALLADDSRKLVAELNRLVRPEGWVIPMQATAVHGYTTEFCRQHGRPLGEVMREFERLWQQASLVVAHNASFDLQILQFSSERTGTRLPPLPSFCTMRSSTDVVNLPGGKWPKLGEAYEFFFGEELSQAHDALADVRACMKVFFALKDSQVPSQAPSRPRRVRAPERMRSFLSGLAELEEHQKLIDSLVGLHRDSASFVEWNEIRERPSPPERVLDDQQERVATFLLNSYQPSLLERLLRRDARERGRLQAEISRAREGDAARHEGALRQYRETAGEWRRWQALAERVLAGDTRAYYQALLENGAFEPQFLGRDISGKFPDSELVEITVCAYGENIIPTETKKLLASGRVSVRAVSKKAFGALYQDHVCSCALRVARDVFAILPVPLVLVQASAEFVDCATGHMEEQCILSVAIPRRRLLDLNFDNLDPSDSIQSFTHRMRFSKNAMYPVEPLNWKAILANRGQTAS